MIVNRPTCTCMNCLYRGVNKFVIAATLNNMFNCLHVHVCLRASDIETFLVCVGLQIHQLLIWPTPKVFI